jgi:hypothetical protein
VCVCVYVCVFLFSFPPPVSGDKEQPERDWVLKQFKTVCVWGGGVHE